MGRVKLQIKKIENIKNRDITFSKRRSGLIKKAHEISVLCDVDVGLILFSPSDRVTVFSGTGNTSIGDILTRYVNLPKPERERIQNHKYIQRTLGKLKKEADSMFQPAGSSRQASMNDAQVEDIQQEMFKCKCQLEDLEKKLRVYECPAGIGSLDEAMYREQVLEQNLENVRLCKDFLQDRYNSASQVMNLGLENADSNLLGSGNLGIDIMETWSSPDLQILNSLDSNGLLPLRDQSQSLDSILPLSCWNMEDDSQQLDFGQAIDVNLSPWADQLYPTGNNHFPVGVHALQLLLSQLPPADPNHM